MTQPGALVQRVWASARRLSAAAAPSRTRAAPGRPRSHAQHHAIAGHGVAELALAVRVEHHEAPAKRARRACRDRRHRRDALPAAPAPLTMSVPAGRGPRAPGARGRGPRRTRDGVCAASTGFSSCRMWRYTSASTSWTRMPARPRGRGRGARSPSVPAVRAAGAQWMVRDDGHVVGGVLVQCAARERSRSRSRCRCPGRRADRQGPSATSRDRSPSAPPREARAGLHHRLERGPGQPPSGGTGPGSPEAVHELLLAQPRWRRRATDRPSRGCPARELLRGRRAELLQQDRFAALVVLAEGTRG